MVTFTDEFNSVFLGITDNRVCVSQTISLENVRHGVHLEKPHTTSYLLDLSQYLQYVPPNGIATPVLERGIHI